MKNDHQISSTAPVVLMPKRDFFRLPNNLREVGNGVRVLACLNGRQVFVPVKLI
jgi:hypothetical protein